MDRIRSLESLRGLLALWVVVGHTIKNSGYSDKDVGWFKPLAQPGLAVDIFIILSGFVIFFLLDKRKTTYGEFIVKRWFRIAPVYLILLFVSLLMLDWQVELISNFPFKNASIISNITIGTDTQNHIVQQFVAHILMLHGAIADSILPSSQYAFLGAAWSISVEWQFYLIAPLLIGFIAKKQWHRLSLSILGICALRALNYGGEGFAINQTGYFIVGIASYYIWKHINKLTLKASHVELLAVVAGAAVYLLLSRTISLLIWVAVLSSIVAQKQSQFTRVQFYILKILHLPVLQWLGKISYSVYMVHMLVFYVTAQLVLTVNPDTSKMALLAMLLPSVSVMTLLISSLTYRYIEQPGIELGQKISSRLAQA